jgi:hypothetical protein
LAEGKEGGGGRRGDSNTVAFYKPFDAVVFCLGVGV